MSADGEGEWHPATDACERSSPELTERSALRIARGSDYVVKLPFRGQVLNTERSRVTLSVVCEMPNGLVCSETATVTRRQSARTFAAECRKTWRFLSDRMRLKIPNLDTLGG